MIDMAVATVPRRELPVAEPRLWKSARVRRFLRLQGAGQVADALISLALAQVVVFQLERGASPGTIAKLLITATLPYVIIGPIAGVVSDRWSRRRSLAITSTVRAALALCAIAVPITHSRLLGYSTATCLLAAGGLAFTLRSSSIPHLVEPRRLVAINSRRQQAWWPDAWFDWPPPHRREAPYQPSWCTACSSVRRSVRSCCSPMRGTT